MHPESSFPIASDWLWIGKTAMTSQFSEMTSSSIFWKVLLFLLSSLVVAPSFMSISLLVLELWQFTFIRDWPEIQKSKYPVSVFPNMWRLEQVRNTKFSRNVSNKMLLNAAKCQGSSFYRFWVFKGKPAVGVNSPRPPRLGLNCKIFQKT